MRQTMVVRSKAAKLQAAAGAMAVKMAKSANDPIYKKFKMFRDKFYGAKKIIQTKYGKRAMMVVRKSATSSK